MLARACGRAAASSIQLFQTTMTSHSTSNYLPYFTQGTVVKGFGRGSKELGVPTANYPEDVVEALPKGFECGVYCGWASVDGGPVYKMVMSVGWNPHYMNKKKSMETHILKEMDDFYGSKLQVCVAKYLRPEMKFESIDALIKAIRNDIEIAEEILSKEDMLKLSTELGQRRLLNGK